MHENNFETKVKPRKVDSDLLNQDLRKQPNVAKRFSPLKPNYFLDAYLLGHEICSYLHSNRCVISYRPSHFHIHKKILIKHEQNLIEN